MNNLQNTVEKLIKSGFEDADFLKMAAMLLKQVTPAENPDAVYKDYPVLTQFVTEEHFRSGNSFDLL